MSLRSPKDFNMNKDKQKKNWKPEGLQYEMAHQKLPLSKQIAYAFGMMGWSIMINLISVILVYLYLTPSNSGLPNLITQVTIWGFFNMIAIITASGRLVDAIYDPFIA